MGLGVLLLPRRVLRLLLAGLFALLLEGRRIDLATVGLFALLRLALLLIRLFLTTLARLARASIAAAALALEVDEHLDQMIDALLDLGTALYRLLEQVLGLAAHLLRVA